MKAKINKLTDKAWWAVSQAMVALEDKYPDNSKEMKLLQEAKDGLGEIKEITDD